MFKETEQKESHQTELDAAQEMNEWFPEYIFGVRDEPGAIPLLARDRLIRQFGPGSAYQQIGEVRAELMLLEDEHQANIASYFCGYPMEILELQALVPMEESIKIFDAIIPPPIKEAKPDRPHSHRLAPENKTSVRLRLEHFEQKTKSDLGGVALFPEYVNPDESEKILVWENDALCAETNPEAFFPEKGGSTRDAKRICATCEVTSECLAYALENDERYGIWGGKSERERRKIRKEMVEEGLLDPSIDDDEDESFETDEQAEIA